MCACVSCKKEETQTEGTTEAITNGSVEDSSAFIPLGMVIDVSQNDMIKDVTYEIKDTEIAVVNFKYNGLQCQFRGSAVHNEFDLAGVRLRSGGAGVAGGAGAVFRAGGAFAAREGQSGGAGPQHNAAGGGAPDLRRVQRGVPAVLLRQRVQGRHSLLEGGDSHSGGDGGVRGAAPFPAADVAG